MHEGVAMPALGFVVSAVAAVVFGGLGVAVLRARTYDWSRRFAATLLSVAGYVAFDGACAVAPTRLTFELFARISWFFAPLSVLLWWMTTSKLVDVNPASFRAYLRSTATLATCMLVAVVAALGAVDDSLFAYSQASQVNTDWTNYALRPSPLYLLMIVLMVAVTLIGLVNVIEAKLVRKHDIHFGLLVTAIAFATLGPLSTMNFYFGLSIPEPALLAAMGLLAYGGFQAVVAPNSPTTARVSSVAVAIIRSSARDLLLIPSRVNVPDHPGACTGVHLYRGVRRLSVEGTGIHLEPGEYDLMAYFIRHRNRLVDHRDMSEKLGLTAELARTRVAAIRKQLGPVYRNAIETRYGYGYVFHGDVLCPQSDVPSALD
jgi:hypothetical protein